MTIFKIATSQIRSNSVIEVWIDNQFVATITPSGFDTKDGIRILSKHPVKFVQIASMVTELHIDKNNLAI